MNLLNNESNYFFPKENIIFKKYKTLNLIGKGCFGKVYSALNIVTKEEFAMKIESLKLEEKILESEAYYLLFLQGFGIPKFITFGHTKTHNILIEELLDKSLNDIYIKTNRKCSLTEACLIAIQLIERLEWIHSKNIIYRDIKPENFLLGKKDPNIIYIIDFGLCKKYRSSKTGKHLLPKRTGRFNGTMKYASVNALLGKEQSRRDDLISLGYMIIFFIKKKLPWRYNAKEYNNNEYIKLIQDKQMSGNGKLFEGLPDEFREYFKYTINLKFEQEPNYDYLKSLFNTILRRMSLDINNIYSNWINNEKKQLIGYPKNNTKRKSNSYTRILKILKEKSNKKMVTGKSQDIILGNFNLEKTNTIPMNKITTNTNIVKNKINNNKNIKYKNKIIKIDLLKLKTNENNNSSKLKEKLNNNRINNNLNIIYNIKTSPNYKMIKNKIINIDKDKLEKLNQSKIINNKQKFINFNKKNIISRNNKLKVINLNKAQIGSIKTLDFSNIKELNKEQYIPLTSRENSPEPKEEKKTINTYSYISIFKRNIKKLQITKEMQRNKSSSNRRALNLDNINFLNYYSANNHTCINNNLYKPIAQNVEIMIINNYRNKEGIKHKKILINTNNSLLKKNNLTLPNKYNSKNIFYSRKDNINYLDSN